MLFKKNAIIVSQEIQTIVRKFPIIQKATIYQGIQAIRTYHAQVIASKKSMCIFGAPKQSVDIMGETFWKNFDKKRVENKIEARMIFNNSLRYFAKKLPKKYTYIRYFDKEFEPLTQTDIHGDNVAIIVWTEEPFIFLIQDTNVAHSYLQYFENMWKQAKK